MSTQKRAVLPERIGRYHVERLLGRGGEGIVLLARDSELDRRVALKLLKPVHKDNGGKLAGEAMIVSRLQHPNIVTLHDVGTYHRMNFLVFEFIDGESLRARIDRQGALPLVDAVVLMSQILAGVAYLHENGILHRDLSPANILITADGCPKVTDFGLSILREAERNTEELTGTLRYMAPEPFLDRPSAPCSDVFTLSSIFFEMLCGRRRFDQSSPGEIIQAIQNGPAIVAQDLALALDAKLIDVLTTASTRDTTRRYADARAMKTALDAYRVRRAGQPGEQHSTVEFLLRRMRVKQGFSALSQHIGELLSITSDDSNAPASRLVNIIGKDLTLSQRVLTNANSAFYGKTEITALPRAIALLGLEQVRMCVTGALLEQQFEQGSTVLRETLLTSFHAAVLARMLAPECEVTNGPDAFTCGQFHALGRLLAIHYFPEEHAAICAHAAHCGLTEETAAGEVLGVAYHELGIGVGRTWKLSATVLAAMQPLPEGDSTPAATPQARVALCAALANALSSLAATCEDLDERRAACAALLARVAGMTTLTLDRIDAALTESAQTTAQYARLLKLNPDQSPVARLLLATPALAGAA